MLLQQIESFLAVAEAANFTHAAQSLHISQPTLSRQVKLLENNLGFKLFQRGRRPLRLTGAGEVFYDGMKKALSQMDYAREMAYAASIGRHGKLSVGFMSGLYTEYMFLDVVNELKDTCQSLEVRCLKKDLGGLVRGLSGESLDVAFGLDFDVFRDAGLRITSLDRIPTVVVMSARHELARKSALDYEDLRGQTIFLSKPMESYRFEEWARGAFDLADTTILEVESVDEANMMVLSELGFTISNKYDPVFQGNPLYKAILLPDNELYPCVCAIDNPANHNAAKGLFLDLVRHTEI